MSTLLEVERVTVAPVVAPSDPILLHAFARRGRPLAVGELLRALSGAGWRLSEVMDLLAEGLSLGLLAPRGHRTDEHGRLVGPLFYELTPAGREFVEADRLL